MPELPEVETIRRDLDREVAGKKIRAVEVSGMRSIRRHKNRKDFISQLEARKIGGVSRKGKYLLLRLDGGNVLVVHLGMSGQLLQAGLVVVSPRAGGRGPDVVAEKAHHQVRRRAPPGVEIDRPDHGLHGVGQDGGLLPPARLVLSLAQQQGMADVQGGGHVGQGGRAHDRGPHLGQLPLRQAVVGAEDVVGHDQLEHGVTEELQSLVRVLSDGLRAPRPVCHGPLQQVGAAEPVADPLGQLCQLLAGWPGDRRLGAVRDRQEAPSFATT